VILYTHIYVYIRERENMIESKDLKGGVKKIE
jgi:hypothetical protein